MLAEYNPLPPTARVALVASVANRNPHPAALLADQPLRGSPVSNFASRLARSSCALSGTGESGSSEGLSSSACPAVPARASATPAEDAAAAASFVAALASASWSAAKVAAYSLSWISRRVSGAGCETGARAAAAGRGGADDAAAPL